MHAPLVALALVLAPGGCGDGDSGDGWVVSSPSAEGMDAAVLEGARAYAFAEGMNTQGVVVVRHGRIVAEWYAEGAGVDSYGASWSMAKSFTSALVGIALDDGSIPSLDAPISDYLPSWQGTDHDAITIRDVITMSSGLDWNEDYSPSGIGSSDIIAMVLTGGSHLAVVEGQPIADEPGAVFNYSSGDTMLLSAVLEGATGMSAGEFAEARLFGPLGLANVDWWRDTEGHTLTYCCLDMRTRDFARFGQLYLEGGTWNGATIVPAAWVEASLASSPAYAGYGYQWWLTGVTNGLLPEDTFSARGHDGQFIYVIPSLDLVVVRNGTYVKSAEEPIATPNLFTLYPSDGLFPGRGTSPPDEWDDVSFLGPIIDSIVEP